MIAQNGETGPLLTCTLSLGETPLSPHPPVLPAFCVQTQKTAPRNTRSGAHLSCPGASSAPSGCTPSLYDPGALTPPWPASVSAQNSSCIWCSSRAAPRQPIRRPVSPNTLQAPACPSSPTRGYAGRICAMISPPASLSGARAHPKVPEVGGERHCPEEGGNGVEGVGVSTQAMFFWNPSLPPLNPVQPHQQALPSTASSNSPLAAHWTDVPSCSTTHLRLRLWP